MLLLLSSPLSDFDCLFCFVLISIRSHLLFCPPLLDSRQVAALLGCLAVVSLCPSWDAQGWLSHMRSRTRPSCLIVLSASPLELPVLCCCLCLPCELFVLPACSTPPRVGSWARDWILLPFWSKWVVFVPLVASASCFLLLLVRFPKCHSLQNVA